MDYAQSAQCLDRQRLGKQRIECMQIARVLAGETKGWANHPAVKMWRGYGLCGYWRAIINEWRSRGYVDNTVRELERLAPLLPIATPHWLGDAAFHLSHQSNLLRKDAAHYSKYFTCPADLPYVWPIGGNDAN